MSAPRHKNSKLIKYTVRKKFIRSMILFGEKKSGRLSQAASSLSILGVVGLDEEAMKWVIRGVHNFWIFRMNRIQ